MRFDIHPTMMKQKQGAPIQTHPAIAIHDLIRWQQP